MKRTLETQKDVLGAARVLRSSGTEGVASRVAGCIGVAEPELRANK